MMRRWIRFGLPAALVVVVAACEPKPEPIRYGEDNGAYCMMTITDQRFGAELVTKKGKVYKFDSIECLAGFLLDGQVASGEIHSLWVTDFAHPSTLIRAEDALYLHGENIRSPMGMNLAAFADRAGLDAVRERTGGEVLGWDEVLELVKTSRPDVEHGHKAMQMP
jgi:copper chaperone NosL